ncbi:MAG: CHAP domain-containing protein [Blautia sp.]|nr:CHAP domain-containing protein [Blautia sp.]
MKKKLLKKLMVLALSAVTAFSAVPVATVTAAGNPYPTTQDVDRDGLYEIPCTRFAWQCVYDRQGIALPAWGNAVGWWQNAINQGYAVGNEPVPGSIAVWSGDYYGHVAYVTANLGNNRFTVDEGGRTDKDQTSSHGVAYGYTLTNAVGGRRPYDSNKVLLGFIYPGVRVPGKPYVSVNPGKANQTTTFS